MKKIVYVFLLAAVIVFISGRIQSSKNVMAENNIKPPALKELKADAIVPVSETTPKILFLLNNENGQSNWSPSLWWSYKQPNRINIEGC
jgi:hypothetical protein